MHFDSLDSKLLKHDIEKGLDNRSVCLLEGDREDVGRCLPVQTLSHKSLSIGIYPPL